MLSTLSWLDFSSAERRKMLEVIQLFQDHETRDELGLGTIRDSFAEMLFPGTTTLQTRARYFLFVPWLYQIYEEQRLTGQRLSDRLLKDEIHLIDALRRAGETDGVIGQRSGRQLHRFPSSIYWIGLGTWGIRKYGGTPYQYLSSLKNHYHQLDVLRAADERELGSRVHPNWDTSLPKRPDDFPAKASFKLHYTDAEYLKERLQLSCPGSMLAFLVQHDFSEYNAPFVWLHPAANLLPSALRDRLFHARNFSETMAGAPLLYNLMLAEKRKNDELIEKYLARILQWREEIQMRDADLRRWDRLAFWGNIHGQSRIPAFTERFVNAWLDRLLSGATLPKPSDSKEMRNLIEERETRLKGGRSRFRSPRHLELWSGDAGTGQLDYRWRVAKRLIEDIIQGLRDNGKGENVSSA